MSNKKAFDASVAPGVTDFEFMKVPTTGYRFFFLVIKNLDPNGAHSAAITLWKSACGSTADDFVEDVIASGKIGTLVGGHVPASDAFVSIENEQLDGLMLKVTSVTGLSRLRVGLNCGIDEDTE